MLVVTAESMFGPDSRHTCNKRQRATPAKANAPLLSLLSRDVGFAAHESGWSQEWINKKMDSRGFPEDPHESLATAGGPQSLRSGMAVQEPSLLVPWYWEVAIQEMFNTFSWEGSSTTCFPFRLSQIPLKQRCNCP